MKILYFDTETTGRNAFRNDVIQLSGIIEIDGKVQEEFNYTCQPLNYDNVEAEALEVNGITLQKLYTFPTAKETLSEFVKLLNKYVDKYNRFDKFYPAGYNVKFDLDFVQQFFVKNGYKYGFGSYQNWQALDALAIAQYLSYRRVLKLDNLKLGTVCKHYNIELQAHDALCDIRATRELIKKFDESITIMF